MERKIGTISINTHTYFHNYGAILHSWAFQQYLLKQKKISSVEIIDYTTKTLEHYNLKYPFVSHYKKKNRRMFLKTLVLYPIYRRRYNKIEKFISKNMILSEQHYIQSTLENAKLDYDTIICESDVIWSAGFFDRAFFLTLNSMKKMRKIAYAPSMADGKLKDDQLEKLSEYLKEIDSISVRESYEIEILKGYTSKEVVHVLDPVFLLDESDYSPIMSEKLIKGQYLLLYLPADNNIQLRSSAKKYAKKHGLKIVEVSSKLNLSFSNKVINTAGVEDFLSLIKYADIVFTNSFHAVCFSIIFHTQFYAFSRACLGKVGDICERLDLSDRYLDNNEFKEKNDIDYNKVEKRLLKEKNNSKKWLLEAIFEK